KKPAQRTDPGHNRSKPMKPCWRCSRSVTNKSRHTKRCATYRTKAKRNQRKTWLSSHSNEWLREGEQKTPNAQRSTFNAQCSIGIFAFGVGRSALDVGRLLHDALAGPRRQTGCSSRGFPKRR